MKLNGMAHFKYVPFSGVVWYQGESDAYDIPMVERYATMFPMLINDWRRNFNNPDLPFLYVQLPRFHNESWPLMREIQRRCQTTMSNLKMSVSIDLGEEKNIHPSP